MGSGFPPLNPGRICQLNILMLLVQAERNPAAFHRLLGYLDELIPGVERVEIVHTAYVNHEDNPPAYFEAVTSFLSRVGAEHQG